MFFILCILLYFQINILIMIDKKTLLGFAQFYSFMLLIIYDFDLNVISVILSFTCDVCYKCVYLYSHILCLSVK